MKRTKEILFLIIFLVGILLFNNIAYASSNVLKVVEQSSETKYLENDQGYISKTIVDSNEKTGEVTVEVKMANKSKESVTSNDTEIILVIDNSLSMDFKTPTGETRKQIVLASAKKLVENVFNTSSNVKMGIVKFHSASGIWNFSSAASIITNLNANKQTVLDGLTKIEKGSTESGTDIQKGLIKAEEMFSATAKNKVIVLLTDGLPNEDAESNHVSDSGMVMTNQTYLKILENTKNELLKIQQNNITLISLMTGLNSGDTEADGTVITSTEEDLKAVETIFGTENKPTAGKFYNAKSTDTARIIENEITKDVTKILNSPLNTVKIVDYFPQDILDNFEFSYVGNASTGEATKEIDPNDKTITWDINTLRGDEVATLKYKLKLKDMNNSELLEKVISTNEKVVLTYKDNENKDYTVVLDSSPKIKLTKEIEGATNQDEKEEIKDETTASSKLPNTGKGMLIFVVIGTVAIIGLIGAKKYYKYKDIK